MTLPDHEGPFRAPPKPLSHLEWVPGGRVRGLGFEPATTRHDDLNCLVKSLVHSARSENLTGLRLLTRSVGKNQLRAGRRMEISPAPPHQRAYEAEMPRRMR